MSTLKYLILSGFLSAGMALPVVASPAVNCTSKSQVAAVERGNFPHQANKLLRDIRSDAESVMKHAATLKSFTGEADMSWFSSADELDHLRTDINNLGAKLCRLEAIRAEAAPWQRRVIDTVTTTARLMADNAEAAIDFANSHPQNLWNPTYRKYVDNIYGEADRLTKVTAHAVREYRQG